MHEELKNISLPMTFEIDKSFNSDRFIKLRLRFMHGGENPNGSFFQVDSMEKAKNSLSNTPILAHVVVDSEGNIDHGSHDMHIEKDLIDEDKFRMTYDEQPIGIIPETNNYEVLEYNGKIYAYTDGYLWSGYCGYSEDIVKRDTDVKLSMEISVNSFQYDSKTNLYNITDYEYRGITLLGKNVGTGMVDAKATTESFSENGKQKLFEIMSDLKEEIIKNQSSKEVDINGKLFTKEDDTLDEKTALISKYNLKIEDLGFEIDELSLEDLETKLKEFSKPETNYVSTYNQKRNAINNAVQTIEKNSDYVYYFLFDFDDKYAYVEKDFWSESGGFQETHGRIGYTFDEITVGANISGEWEEIFLTYLTAAEKATVEAEKANFATMAADFEAYKTAHTTDNTEVEILRTFQSTTLASERKEAEDEIFGKFEKQLSINEEFITLREKANDYELDAISEKCFSILGRTIAKFSLDPPKKKETIKIPVVSTISKEDPYGGLIEHYTHK